MANIKLRKRIDSVYQRWEFPRMLHYADPEWAERHSTPPNLINLKFHCDYCKLPALWLKSNSQ